MHRVQLSKAGAAALGELRGHRRGAVIQRARATFIFGIEPQEVELTPEQVEAIKADKLASGKPWFEIEKVKGKAKDKEGD